MGVKSPATEPNQVPDDVLVLTSENQIGGSVGEDDDVFLRIRNRFMVHQTFWSEIHNEALEDDRFVAGWQWPDEVRREREEDRRPVLTYNLLPSFTRQITNKIRQERPQVKVTPVESNKGADPRIKNTAGTQDYSLADIYSGLIRNIESVSRADQAYDTAVQHAVDHGFGYFTLMNIWSKIDPFVQELRINRVKNSYTVYLDPDAQEIDFRDAQDCFIFSNMRRSTFEHKWPDVSPDEFAGAMMGSTFEGWYDGDSVRVAQYMRIEYRDDEVLMLSNGKTVWNSMVEAVLDELKENTGVHILKDAAGQEMRKKVKRPVVSWRKMTASTNLEGPIDLPFSSIPVFPVLGEERLVDGRTIYESAIRQAKDAQKSYNYWRTAAAETVALAPRAPYMATERQIAGHEELYENANTRNIPYMLYNHVDGVAPPARQFNANPAAAELQNAIQDGIDMQTIIGLHDASLGRESNEKSGKAIIARQNAGATSTFQFPDNLGRAMEQMGRLIVEAIPQLYDTQRVIRIRKADDTEDFVEINQTAIDEESGETFLISDIAYGKYDVVLETGPSYATQRQEAADLQMELLKVLGPEMAANIVHLIVRNLGVPGSEEVSQVLRKMLPDELKSEEEKMADLPAGVTMDPETEELMKDGEPWEPEPTPEMILMQKQQEIDEAGHQAELAKSEATMATADADKKQAEAKVATAEAAMAKAQAEMQTLQGGQENGDMMADIQGIIQQTMEEHELNESAHKEATEEMIANAVVDALKRVRGFVDRKVKSDLGELATSTKEEGPASASTTSQANGGAAPAPAAAVILNVEPKPDRIDFKYDGDGQIVSAEPIYSDQRQEEQGEREEE
jgi:hypothetical protein